jgi:hypothetical protein
LTARRFFIFYGIEAQHRACRLPVRHGLPWSLKRA